MKKIITGSCGVSGPQPGVRRKLGTATGFLAAAVLCLVTVAGPNLAHAAHGGGGGGFHGGGMGGFHGGGFGGVHSGGLGGVHAGGFGGLGGFHGGGFSGSSAHPNAPLSAGMGGFRADGVRGGSDTGTVVLHGGAQGGQWHRGWRDGRYGWWSGYNPYLWSEDGLYDDYSAAGQSGASQYWYYCTSPAGYYPYVNQCSVPWQTVPAG